MNQPSEPTPPPIQDPSYDHSTSSNAPPPPAFILTDKPKRGLEFSGRQRSTAVLGIVAGLALCLCVCVWGLLHATTGVAAKSFSYTLIDDRPSEQARIRSVDSLGRAIQASVLRPHYKTVSWQAVVVNSTGKACKGRVIVTFRGAGTAVIVNDTVFLQLASRETSRVSNAIRIRDYEADEIVDASCEVVIDE